MENVATVIINYPVRMMSLSTAAVDRPQGIVHCVTLVIGPSEPRGWWPKKDRSKLDDGFRVTTACGKNIDAYPETGQMRRDCLPCSGRVTKSGDVPLIRILPPVDESVWALKYWDYAGPCS